MGQKPVPKYYGLRIYIISTTLYFFLIIPFLLFLAFQRLPDLAERSNLFAGGRSVADSLMAQLDTLGIDRESLDLDPDSLEVLVNSFDELSEDDLERAIQEAVEQGEDVGLVVDSLVRATTETAVTVSGMDGSPLSEDEAESFGTYFRLLFFMLLAAFLAGFVYNFNFKRFFRKKRNGRQIPEKLFAWCKKQLEYTPVVNSLILTMPNITGIVYSLIVFIGQSRVEGEIERELFIQFFYLTLLATLLEFLFVYYWQKHRVHIKYVDHIFTREELRRQVFRNRSGRIRNRLMVASGMTTFLPLLIVMVYLILSLTSVKELQLESITATERDILIGPWGAIVNPGKTTFSLSDYENLFYVNAVDSIIMLVGIGTGITVSFIYLLLFIKWTNQDITRPVRELLLNIRNTRAGGKEHYTVVRTNDEIGELAEGYNEMTGKIHRYLEEIMKMNRDLEQKVKERTSEVVFQKEEIEAQKEEIETQKEEIEAQLDLTTEQRDTISRQNELILDSIRYAERIQAAMLPPDKLLTEYVTDHFVLFRPRDIVSGDYYWTASRDGKLLLAAADCTGHGVPGAFLSMLGISSMNEIVNRSGAISPNLILEQLRGIVIHSLHQTGSRDEAQDGIEIALCMIDPEKQVMEYAGANRPLYLVRKNGKGRFQCLQYRGDKMPIGIYQQESAPFSNHEIGLRKGDSIYLFSDGYVDQLGGPSRKTFRSKHFRELLVAIQEHPMKQQRKILLQRHEEWKGHVEQIDDILVMGIRL